MGDNIEIFYNIKAMFMDSYKNPIFTSHTISTINALMESEFQTTGFSFNYPNKYMEVIITTDENPVIVVGKMKSALCQFIFACVSNPEINEILYMTNNATFTRLTQMIKDPTEVFKIVNYMYSILFMGNTPQGHLFRIMM